jgi:hypothetical protein
MLFPAQLTARTIKKYGLQPALSTQSPDRRWILTQAQADFKVFEVFDTAKPDKDPVTLSLPGAISTLTGTHAWKLMEWSTDNSHVLLKHIVTNGDQQASEYIMVNREDPTASFNLTARLGINPTTVELRDKKFDQYFVYTAEDHKLQTASLDAPKPSPFLDAVLAFKTYGDKTVLYATDKAAAAGRTVIKLQDDDKSYTLRTVATDTVYMLDLTKYNGDWFVVAGASGEDRTYIYKNPVAQLNDHPQTPPAPVQILKTDNPTYVAFSDNARFIVTENGQQFSVYDAEYDKKFAYTASAPLDAPQLHATWMDGGRLTYLSKGKVAVFDYDNTNRATLSPADAGYGTFFDRDYKVLYGVTSELTKDAAGKDITQFSLSATALRTPQDQ